MPSLSMVTLPLLGVLTEHRVNMTAGVGGLAPSSAAGGAYAHISPSWGISPWGISPWGSSGGAAAVGQQRWGSSGGAAAMAVLGTARAGSR
jgi:hypothetical protein